MQTEYIITTLNELLISVSSLHRKVDRLLGASGLSATSAQIAGQSDGLNAQASMVQGG
jgi:hypothetical protein